MIEHLVIKNFALIEELELDFESGLTVISGETGAGKSIILEALEIVLGERASPDFIRTGADGFEIQASFDISVTANQLKGLLPDYVEDQQLIISRSLSRSGKSKIYINGKLATLSQLALTMSQVVNICRQGQQLSLLNPSYHLDLVDAFGGLEPELLKYQAKFDEWRQAETQLELATNQSLAVETERQELEELIKDLEPLKLSVDLRAELEAEVKRHGSHERIDVLCQAIFDGLNSDGEVINGIQSMRSALKELERLDPNLTRIKNSYEQASQELQAVRGDLELYLSRQNLDQAALELARERLAEVARLERKYKTNCAGLLELLHSSQTKLAALATPENITKLRNQAQVLAKDVNLAATTLDRSRRTASTKLANLIIKELADLNLKEAKFEVAFTGNEISRSGLGTAEFLLSLNPGEPLRALKKIASGGELSRLMLVMKKILNEKGGVTVLIFDEADTGVSGAVARMVGEELKVLAQKTQTICITHLPQVASLADNHYLVSKHQSATSIKKLTKAERIDEVARMLSGHVITATAKQTAIELIGS